MAPAVRILSSAAEDIRRQSDWYAVQSPELKQRFLASVRAAIALARSNPDGFARIDQDSDIRIVVLRKFPFRLLDASRGEKVVVIAVAHTAREPGRGRPH
jgi:hypothetical protein